MPTSLPKASLPLLVITVIFKLALSRSKVRHLSNIKCDKLGFSSNLELAISNKFILVITE